MDKLEDVKRYSVWELAHLAECAGPDAIDSPGALFLIHVRESIVENWISGYLASDTEQAIDEIVDSAPDVYDHTRWSEFTDLAAWREELEDAMPTVDLRETTLTEVAGVALCLIAERLARALYYQLTEPD